MSMDNAFMLDIPGYKSPSTITGDCFRPDLLLSFSNKCLYIVELTVGYETNLEKNAEAQESKIFGTCY